MTETYQQANVRWVNLHLDRLNSRMLSAVYAGVNLEAELKIEVIGDKRIPRFIVKADVDPIYPKEDPYYG